MMDFSTWIAFTAASLVLSAAPGPDNLFVLAQSAVYGKKAGLIVVLGLCTGLVINTLAAASTSSTLPSWRGVMQLQGTPAPDVRRSPERLSGGAASS